jgi:hypothetical protein
MPNRSLQDSILEQADKSQSEQIDPKLVNPLLRDTPIHEPADVIPSKQQDSLLDWLKRTGRLIARTDVESVGGFGQEEEEIVELIVDEPSYEDEDDSDEEIED